MSWQFAIALFATMIVVSPVPSAQASSTLYWMWPDGARALGETVKDLLVSDNTLFFTASDIGGEGTLPVEAGTQFYGVGSYNGTTWSSLATGIVASGSCGTYNGRPSAHSLTGSASDLYVGGEFTSINGVSASLVARRTGGTWSALGSGLCYGDTGGDYHDINVFLDGSSLYAFGTFRQANGSTDWVNGIAKWDGTTWSALGGGMSASSYPKYGEAMAKDTVNNVLYVGGHFDAVNASIGADGAPSGAVADTAGIACWNGTTWSSIGAGLSTSDHVNAMTYDSGVLYVGGDFTTIGGVASQFVAKFTPSGPCAGTWSAVGVGGLASSVIGSGTTELCKTEDDSRRGVWSTFFNSGSLYVGCFPDNDLYPQALKWNGSAWSHFDSTCTGTCTNKIGRSIGHPRDIVEFGGSLWAAGTWYVSEGGSTGLAKWATSLDPLRPTFTSATTATNGSTFTFTVTFDVAVSGVAAGDFSNSGTITGCSFGVTATSTTVYTLTVSSCAAGDGTVIPVFAINGATRISDSVTGPNSATTSTATITRDTVAPTISSFSSTTGDGSYKAGSTINITATADETVQSGNTITVTLDTGATVVLTAASASASLTGNYTVAAGQTSADLTVSSFTIGTVADTAGNAMTSTTVPSGANNIAGAKAIVIDTTAPTATLGVPDLASASDTGVSSTDDITSDDTPTLSVVVTNLEAGGTGYVKASKTGSSDVTCTLSAGSCTLGSLAQGTWSIVSYQNDAAGNDGSTSAASAALSITVFTTAPTTATFAASAATSSSATITFTVTGSHQLDCTSLSTTATTTSGTDFVLTAGISAISSIAQTSTTVCTITATSTATAGGGAVVSTLTVAASFSVADPAGNALTTLTGSPQSITVTVPAPPSSGGGGGGSSATTTTTTTAPATTTTTTVPTATSIPKVAVTTTTTPPSRPRLSVPGIVAPTKLTVLLPTQQTDSTKIISEYFQALEKKNQTQTADKLRDAVTAAAPAIGNAIADAVARLAQTLENKESSQLEVVKAKAAVADASAQVILVALNALNGNLTSLALPVTKNSQLPELDPGKTTIISPKGSEPGKVDLVAGSTLVLSSPKENLSLAMTAIDSSGEKVPVSQNNSINVDHGQSLAMTGSGFKPKTEVKIWMFSNPRSIGTVFTDANGSFAAEVPMPDNLVPGNHTAQVNGNNKDGSLRSLNLGLEVDLPSESPAAKTKTTPDVNSANIYFRGDDSKLFWGAVAQLKKLLPKLRKASKVSVFGYSHSNDADNNKFAVELSKTRAENVAAWLRQRKIGVVSVEQFGYDKRSARAKPKLNRRVEIKWSD